MSAFWPLALPQDRPQCKICSAIALPFGQCDINQGGPPGAILRPALGQAIHYHCCSACGFIFTAQLDHWQSSDYTQHIYNSSYVDVDPDYVDLRPRSQAHMLKAMLRDAPAGYRILDYGAGSGKLAAMLREQGWFADSADPYSGVGQADGSAYDLVCAFEVIEHSADPLLTLADMRAKLKPHGSMLISTLLVPPDITTLGCQWWYCAPRNGHISLFTPHALNLALQHIGAKRTHSISDGLHVAYF